MAADGVPVVVTCRVLGLACQPYYRWLAAPVTDADLVEAYRADALFDAHREDPEFGYRYLADEAHDAGQVMARRTAWRICSTNRWWSAFGKKKARGSGKKAGPPVHDDLLKRRFHADAPNQVWVGDITEHWTGEGKLFESAHRLPGPGRNFECGRRPIARVQPCRAANTRPGSAPHPPQRPPATPTS